MNRDFEFKQLLRAYRGGIISEADFEREMKQLETVPIHRKDLNGAGRSQGIRQNLRVRARGRDQIPRGRQRGRDQRWRYRARGLEVCTTDCIRGGLKMVAERESYHGRAFEARLKELGGKMPDRMNDAFKRNLAYLRDKKISDARQTASWRDPFPESRGNHSSAVRFRRIAEGRSDH